MEYNNASAVGGLEGRANKGVSGVGKEQSEWYGNSPSWHVDVDGHDTVAAADDRVRVAREMQ